MDSNSDLKKLLDAKADAYNQPSFIAGDPISVPHSFSLKQDIEIAGFFAAILSWGNRTTIIRNTAKLMEMMDNKPYRFIRHHHETDLRPFVNFVHRTFNATDLLYFIAFLQYHYQNYNSLEDAFVNGSGPYAYEDTGHALAHFHDYFFSIDHPIRTRKHIATPNRNSACKRLNMYLRWMVRKDTSGVDFGIWTRVSPRQLVCPLDVHVARVAQRLGLIENTKSNWTNALALTHRLKELNPADPALYDFALFGLGMAEKF